MNVTGVLGSFVNSHVAPKYLRHGKRPEHGIAGSVGKDQDTNIKFTPQLVISNGFKSAKYQEGVELPSAYSGFFGLTYTPKCITLKRKMGHNNQTVMILTTVQLISDFYL